MGHGDDDDRTFKDVYFYRMFIPLIISVLVLFAIIAVITTPPGTKLTWATFPDLTYKSSEAIIRGGRRLVR